MGYPTFNDNESTWSEMTHQAGTSDRHDIELDAAERQVSVSHLVHTLRAYAPAITISILSVATVYAVCAILFYLLSPAERTTVQPFRLEFRGATEGTLPNGVRFSPTEIISTPILLRVYASDQLSRFTTFGDFSRSFFVLESNREYEKLLSEYQARLSDARLTPLDRDRIQKEFEAKRESINKNDFALSYARDSNSGDIPDTLARKVVADVLNTWANFAINEQHGLDYRVSVLSPQILDQTDVASDNDPIVAIEILRSKVYRVLDNIEEVSKLPSAELIKTSDRMSLAEIRLRLEDIVRFRLEPLVGVARASGLVTNPPRTIHFLENQLAYDQRRLQAARTNVTATRDALALYSSEQRTDTGAVTSLVPHKNGVTEGETVMPQLSDTFLDRLVTLSKQAGDTQYRQKIVQRYQEAVAETIPIEQAVSYQEQVLSQMKGGPAASAPLSDGRTVRAEIDAAMADVRRLIVKVNEINQLLSRNLNPSTQLFSLVRPPSTNVEHARSLGRLALYGLLVLLVSLPIIVIICLLHNRVREEDAAVQS
jgi:hypothetical protein